MDILFIPGVEDYDALRFEESYAGQRVDMLLKKLKQGELLVDTQGDEITHRIIDIPDIVISREFVEFIKTQYACYDMNKMCSFYLPHQII